jgi:asparagine synthase (glutamine-hydrolysing)
VLLVHAADDDAISYVVVGGSLEYVLDETEQPDWVRFLRAVDGERDLGQLAAAAGCDLAAIRPLLGEAVAMGVLALSDEPARSVG